MAEQRWHTKQKIKKTIKAQLIETKSQQSCSRNMQADTQPAGVCLGVPLYFPKFFPKVK